MQREAKETRVSEWCRLSRVAANICSYNAIKSNWNEQYEERSIGGFGRSFKGDI